jgi:hypothetical protein
VSDLSELIKITWLFQWLRSLAGELNYQFGHKKRRELESEATMNFSGDCPITATKLDYRLTTDEEKAASTVVDEFSKRWTEIVQFGFTKNTYKSRQKVYPLGASI